MVSCWLCGRNGQQDKLDRHHIFGGANRKKSDKYGLVVLLCHHDCHIFGKYAVHNNAETMQALHEYGQRKAMVENNWSIDDFRREFGKNYLGDAERSLLQQKETASAAVLERSRKECCVDQKAVVGD